MSLDFPLSVRSGNFNFNFFCLGRGEGAVFLPYFLPPVPEKEILDFIAHGSIRVFTVCEYTMAIHELSLGG